MLKTVIIIEGMKCGMCECHINNLIRKIEKVNKVKSSYIKGICIIKHREIININEVTKVIQDAGYIVKEYQSNING